jgi:hemerythrin-like domain-containing protein
MSKNITEILEAEHRVIEQVVSAVRELNSGIEAGQKPDLNFLRKVVDFMRVYADKCHHGKEEELLFPALGNLGVPIEGCPLGALMGEHTRGRFLVTNLAEGVDLLAAGDEKGLEKIKKGLTGIVSLYPNHIWKEDFLLFPMTHKVMSPDAMKDMLQPFMDVDERIGIDALKKYRAFAEEVSK